MSTKKKMAVFSVFIGSAIITFVGTFQLSLRDGKLNTLFYESTMLHIFIMAVAAFILLKNVALLLPPKSIILSQWLSKYSFGVFMIHPLVLEHLLITRLGITTSFIHPSIGISLSFVLCLAISYLLIYLLSRLPFGKYTF